MAKAKISEEYEFIDNSAVFQYDLKNLPQVVRDDLDKKRKYLKTVPDRTEPFEVIELKGKYKGKYRIRLTRNYRYVFSINVDSHKIYSYRVRPRSQSYRE